MDDHAVIPPTQTAESLAARVKQLEDVQAITGENTRELRLSTLLGLITRRAMELVGGVVGAVLLWDEASQTLEARA